jgi:hypothetical protein
MSDDDPVTTPILQGDDPLPPEQEALVMKITAICWEQFGRGANIQIDHDCYDRAVNMGALRNLRIRLSRPDPFTEEELKNAKWSSHKAGREARKMARKLPSPNGIEHVTPDIFEAAFRTISDKIEMLNLKRDRDNLFKIVAVWCP